MTEKRGKKFASTKQIPIFLSGCDCEARTPEGCICQFPEWKNHAERQKKRAEKPIYGKGASSSSFFDGDN